MPTDDLQDVCDALSWACREAEAALRARHPRGAIDWPTKRARQLELLHRYRIALRDSVATDTNTAGREPARIDRDRLRDTAGSPARALDPSGD